MKEKIARLLLEAGSVALSPKKPFTYSSGIKSPIYCDNRILLSKVDARAVVIDSYIEAIKGAGMKADVIAGVATGAIPWAGWVAERLRKPLVYVREKAKEHGKLKQVEGELKKGSRVIVIEDLISTGRSSFAAVDVLNKAGAVVVGCFAIFSYNLPEAHELYKKANVALFSLSDFHILVEAAVTDGSISEAEKEMVLSWNKDPNGWGKG